MSLLPSTILAWFLIRALGIQQELAPDSLAVAASLNNIGNVFNSQGKLDQALNLHYQAYKIGSRDLIATHPNLISSAYQIANCALKLADQDIEVEDNVNLALEYSDIVIAKDPEYKFAYLTKALALQKQGKLNDSLEVLIQALTIDSSYADAKLAKIELLTKIAEDEAKKGNKVSFENIAKKVIEDFRDAQETKPSTYDQDYIARKTAELILAGIKDVKIELPKQEFQIGDARFNQELALRLKKLESLVKSQGIKLDLHQDRLNQIENRLDILDDKVLTLEYSMNIIDADIRSLNEKITANQGNSELIAELELDKSKAQARRNIVREFNANPDLGDYYHHLLSELTAIYIASKAIESEQITREKTEIYAKGTSYLASACELIPVIGNLAGQIVSFAGSSADAYQNAVNKEDLLKITKLTSSISEFDQIAIRIAIQLTTQNQAEIIRLNQAKIPTNWQSYLTTAITQDLESAISQYLSPDKSQASLAGKKSAHDVIQYLQKNRNAETLRFEEQTGQGQQLQRKESVISGKIIDRLRANRDASRKQQNSAIPANTSIPATIINQTREGNGQSLSARCSIRQCLIS
jgi:tetratricopeptide (TPR) repeat protein